jgi:3-methylcrotonyl-CoA carboxylase alpha subunit
MNTRLQVEHPVTEALTGLDLVRLQLEVAAGRPLPLAQEDVAFRGHALECRLYAEDPHNDDLPCPGRVLHVSEPQGPGIRVDSGLDTGCEVSVHYDPLLSKIVTWGQDRTEAIQRMRDALRRTVVLGVVTNLARLRAILEHPAFAAGELHTGFIDEHLRDLVSSPCPPLEAIAAAAAALGRGPSASAAARTSPADPWASLGAWRMAEER